MVIQIARQINSTNSQEKNPSAYQYQLFKNNLSAYIDNELNDDENLRIKKLTINNKNARKELEDSFNLRKIMNLLNKIFLWQRTMLILIWLLVIKKRY